jgi:hypothetical protein
MKMRASDVPTDMSNKKCVHHKIRPSIQIIKRYNGNDPKINRVLPLPQDQTWPHDSPVEGEEPYLF